ncbi:alpha/beta hydrolase [Amycolatopsis aidingensis]|uniref:alpha/beta hydrolase n=1 Tax=Amycolatopsis aidingensis TaxID=2842453 RepID=UPI001C0B12D9|nr:alpha/beta hydrolase [Amycolatopsis aidingensis]
MVDYAQLKQFDRGELDAIADAWTDQASNLRDRADAVGEQISALSGWEGEAGEAARSGLEKLRNLLNDAADEIDKLPPKITDAADTIDEAKREAASAVDGADKELEVGADGVVRINTVSGGPSSTGMSTDSQENARDTLQGKIDDAVRKATEADEDGASAVRKHLPAQIGVDMSEVGEGIPSIPTGADPAKVNEWWNGLSPLEKETLLFTDSATLGNLDGIPAEVRDRANRFVLDEHRAILEQRQEQYPEDSDVWQRSQDRLDAIKDLESKLGDPHAADQEVYLLAFDAQDVRDGENLGRFALSYGNPDTADNVSTAIPGMDSAMNGDIGGKEDAWLERGERLQGAAGGNTASIVWFGYDAPGKSEVISDESAQSAVGDLQDFQSGLRATHEGPASHNTVIGHSYGGSVLGITAAHEKGIDADSIAFVGATGGGAETADQLNVNATDGHGEVYSGRTDRDFIGGLGFENLHGDDPNSPGYGADTVFETGDGGGSGDIKYGHSPAYWEDGSVSLDNIGHIIAGEDPTEDPTPYGNASPSGSPNRPPGGW